MTEEGIYTLVMASAKPAGSVHEKQDMAYIIDGMIIIGSALMVWNIWRYRKYMRSISDTVNFGSDRILLTLPYALLIGFLIGYVVVALFGKPDIIIGGILLGGSIFVAIIVNTLVGVTERVTETERLEARLMAAEESSRAKTTFLSNMSHEIRTPMNAIIGIDTLALKEEGISPSTRDQLLKIDASARHLLALINDILDMSRIESGQMIIRDEPIQMDDLLDQVGSIIQSQCDEKGLTFIREIHGREGMDRTTGPCCMGDGVKLRQVLINILGNSVKFTPAPGTISFIIETQGCCAGRCGGRGCHVNFIMKDTGIGMDEEFLPKLFDTFSQEDSTSTNRYGGSGLGMAITKRLVDMMGGTITVESKKGEGTTFVVGMDFRPISSEVAAALPKSSETDSSFSIEGCRILFAEDVDINAEILADLLEMEGIESDRAENGQIAVEKFSAAGPGTYDAILMDMRMPVMDGIEATRAIRALDREDAKRIPIVALTANAFYSDIRQCLEAGMNAHLSKPVDSDLMIETLTGLIAESRSQKTDTGDNGE